MGNEFKVADSSLMMIFLLEECNLSCIHCVRESEPMDQGYKLTHEQFRMCLSDSRELGSIQWVHFSGGEPTLWSDGDHDLVDLLVEISGAGFEPGFTTNGTTFNDPGRCRDLLSRYFREASNPLRLYLSIDTFHRNFDVESERAGSLDNVIEYKMEMSDEKAELLNVNVITVISRDYGSMLPDEMVRHYESNGVDFVYVPLRPKGKAEALAHLCPDLSSDKPEDLGAYYHYRPRESQKRPEEAPNVVLIGDDYHLPNPWRTVARLGRLPKSIIDAFSNDR